jgi:hypothetical protein
MHDIKAVVEKLFPVLGSHKDEEHIEVELRLGKYNGSFFDTNVGKETFERVLKGLRKYDKWDKTESSISDMFYNDKDSIRITSNQDTGEQKMVQKINVIKEDFYGNPLDMRFSVSREIPTWGEYEMDRKRTKTRYSFVRKNLSIDMTTLLVTALIWILRRNVPIKLSLRLLIQQRLPLVMSSSTSSTRLMIYQN